MEITIQTDTIESVAWGLTAVGVSTLIGIVTSFLGA